LMLQTAIMVNCVFLVDALDKQRMSRSRSRSGRKLNAYTRFTKSNLPACHREAVKKFGEGKRAN